MSLFIETLRVEADGSIPLLSYHQARMTRTLGLSDENTQASLFEELQLRFEESVVDAPQDCVRKYRILYTKNGITEAYVTPYLIRPIGTLTLTPITFDYSTKSADRININSAYHEHPETDDILMIKSGLLTDTSYANIALLDGEIWYTPESPLLAGCRRQHLIDVGQVTTKKIRIEEINSYSYLMLFNAMIPFGRVLLPTGNLHV